ncbi:hypothetical protein ASC89_04335 [Devosia sp. Root413D1]|uniref:DUF6894 family protein n=1 Tax=Devosia sp. Root413D1 TaxID=1736531 RepID=UPI0006FD423F|nr:hypothetical protein ASC89_04335 [Devosia sp. Root413D1]
MPQYFFDLYDGSHLAVDNQGKALRDEAAARREAAAILSEVTRDTLASNSQSRDFRVVVRLAQGHPLWETHLQWETHRFQRS